MSGKNQNGGSTATLNISEIIQEASSQRESLNSNLDVAREAVCTQMTKLADQLRLIDDNRESMGVEEFEAPDLSAIDYLYAEPEPTPKARRRSTASSGDGSTRGRGGGDTTLPNTVLLAMDRSKRGTEFSISDVHAAVQEAPHSYTFAGSEKGQRTIVNQVLGSLTNEGKVDRVSRGFYALTAKGSKAAKAILKDLNSGSDS